MRSDVIVNAAAYMAVDKADSEPELARLINATTPGVIAETANQLGAPTGAVLLADVTALPISKITNG